jgi:hypothetical protein
MKDFLQDLVAHTHSLGFIPLIKISATSKETSIESMAEDRSVIINAKTHSPIDGLDGTFGMPNLNKLDIHLKCPEYKENAKITVSSITKDDNTFPVGLHFENEAGDFENDYRFMNSEIINDRLKSVKFKGAEWAIEFEPANSSIQKMKFQSNAHSEETVFQVKTEGGNLVFSFGDSNSHAGSFVFQPSVDGKLKSTWSWPVNQVIAVLNLTGDKTMRISDQGAMQITVDSGLGVYNYTLPAQSK